MKKLTLLFLTLTVILSSLFLSGCGGHSLSKALKSENFKYMQITADYTIVNTAEKKDKKTENSSSQYSDSSNYVVSSDLGNSASAENNDVMTLIYKRYDNVYYQSRGLLEAYYYPENGKNYALISEFDDTSADNNKRVWVRSEVSKDAHKNVSSTFDYDAFGTIKKSDFKHKKGEYILKDDKVNDFIKSLLKIEMGKNGFSDASVKLKVENNHIASMNVEFYRNKTYRFKIDYEMSYNKLQIALPQEYSDKQ